MGFKVASRVRGLSDEAFREAFGTKEQCRAALVRLRWPDGFVCPCCGHREHCVLAGRGLYQCNRCKKQTSPTAGTIFHATKLPLTLWFAAIHLVVTAKNGISSVELGRRLGVKQPTAWAVKHKIMAVMARREGETRLTGRVEMDDAYLGGVRTGGKRGRGAAGKTPFVAAVSTSPEGRPRKLKLAPVKGFRKCEIARGAKHWLAPGAAVVTDGLGCWSALDEAACSHQAIRTGSGRQAARMASFKWVNTTLGNIKSAITGTYCKLGPDHAGRYLASFAWRYNRRYQLQTMIPRFVHSAARTQPLPYRLLIAGCLSGISRKEFGVPRGRDGCAIRIARQQHRRCRVGGSQQYLHAIYAGRAADCGCECDWPPGLCHYCQTLVLDRVHIDRRSYVEQRKYRVVGGEYGRRDGLAPGRNLNRDLVVSHATAGECRCAGYKGAGKDQGAKRGACKNVRFHGVSS